MTRSGNEPIEIAKLISDPSVLKAAWLKVKRWYESTELKPEPELSYWTIFWEQELRTLGEELASGRYSPTAFPMVQYPKKNSMVRHYCMPSVRDQVAFAVFGTLLAPVCELQMPNVSFGNRWFRGIYKTKNGNKCDKYEWKKRPFDLSGRNFYEPYQRSYGLFRRVAHWTAESLVRGTSPKPSSNPHLEPSDYPEDSLPAFINQGWWSNDASKQNLAGFWIQSDLQLAYPSVKLSEFALRLTELCAFERGEAGSESPAGFDLNAQIDRVKFAGMPNSVASILAESNSTRQALASRLIELLSKIQYSNYFDDWRPAHATQELPDEIFSTRGIPTGLAISGFLMNVYLTKVDQHMCFWMAKERNFAYMRFADDFIIMSDCKKRLTKAVDTFWSALADSTNSRISQPAVRNNTNLRINWSKTKPESWSNCLSAYLAEEGWSSCVDCGTLIEGNHKDGTVGTAFADWFDKACLLEKNHSIIESIDKDCIEHHSLGPFVTYLVERLSDIVMFPPDNRH